MMRTAIQLFGSKQCSVEDSNKLAAIGDIIPDYIDLDPSDEIPSDKRPSKLRVHCEDYSGNCKLPHFGMNRPGIDYYLSDLNLCIFVVSEITAGKNFVYMYDERGMGKDCEALCTLRFFHHFRSYIEAGETGNREDFPDKFLGIFDNCVGQNKSQIVFMFYALLSLLFYEIVDLLFLWSGHSHMYPDRVTSWCRRSIERKDLFHPKDFEKAFNVGIIYHVCRYVLLF